MCCFGVLATARVHFCEIDGRVLGGMQLGVLVQVRDDAGAFLRD